MANTDLATSYAALILADDGIEITADKIIALTTAANVEVEPIWASLLAKALEGKNVKDILLNFSAPGPSSGVGAVVRGGSAAAVEAAKEEEKTEEEEEEEEEDSDDDDAGIGFGLFD